MINQRSKTIVCPSCSEEILENAKKCKHCGEKVVMPDGTRLNKLVDNKGTLFVEGDKVDSVVKDIL